MASEYSVTAPAAPRLSRTLTIVLAIAVLTVSMLAAGGMRLVFSPLQEAVKASLNLSDLQISLVQGLATALPVALVSIPLGRLTDRTNRVILFALLGGLSVIGTAVTAFAATFPVLFIARMLAGVGGTCSLPVAISLVADLVSPEARGRGLLFIQVGQMMGAALAFGVGGTLLSTLTDLSVPGFGPLTAWRQIHLVFALASCLPIVALVFVREPERHELESKVGIQMREALAQIWAMRGYVIPLYIGQLTVVMADTAAGIWAAPVLIRNYKLHPSDFAGWMALVILLSGFLGAAIGGVGADMGQKGRLPGGMLTAAIGAVLLSIPASLFPIAPSVPLFAWALALLLVCGSITSIVTATAIAVYVPNDVRGLCLSLFIVIGAIGGFGIAPSLVPLVSGALGGEMHVSQALAGVGVATSVMASIGFTLAIRRQPMPHTA